MGLLDILGSAATIGAKTQGQYLQGQAAGQQKAQQNLMAMLNAKRQKTLDEQNAAQNQFDATMKLQGAGYMPVQQVQDALANTQRAQFGQGAPIAPGDISGLAAMAINAPKAKEQAAGLNQRVTNPFSKQEFAFNYDASPQGRIEKRMQAVDLQKTGEKQKASIADVRDKLNRLRLADPTMPPQQASIIAGDSKLFDAWSMKKFGLAPDNGLGETARHNRAMEVLASEKAANTGTNLPPAIAARVGQFGEMLKKAQDVFAVTDNLNITVGQSAAEDIAEHGFGLGSMRIPGTKGIGSMMVNNSPEYSQYQAALTPWVLAAGHAQAGLRVSDVQFDKIRKSVELKPGDFNNPNVVKQKNKNFIDLINSIGGSLPETAIVKQEDQMWEDEMQSMIDRGYKRVGRGASGASRVGGPSEDQKNWDAAAKKYGRVKVQHDYGPRPLQ